jgi:folate-dependent phosphoribosylglycinamide formyltransferase PurN
MDCLVDADIRLVVSSKASAFGLVRARRFSVPSLVLGKDVDWLGLAAGLKARGINSIFLLGFMKLLPAEFLQAWDLPVYNIHPSLLPKYPGLSAIENSHADSAAMGVTVHRVNEEVDAGERILQKKVFLENKAPSEFSTARIRMAFAEQNLIRNLIEGVSFQ